MSFWCWNGGGSVESLYESVEVSLSLSLLDSSDESVKFGFGVLKWRNLLTDKKNLSMSDLMTPGSNLGGVGQNLRPFESSDSSDLLKW